MAQIDTRGEGRVVTVMPALGWTAVYSSEARPVICWALTDQEILVGLVFEKEDGRKLVPADSVSEPSCRFQGFEYQVGHVSTSERASL